MSVKLPRLRSSLSIADQTGAPSPVFQKWWSQLAQNLEAVLDDVIAAISAADSAQSTADEALVSTGSIHNFANLGLSFPDSTVTITGHDAGATATVLVNSHNRVYGNGSFVTIGANTITGLAYSTRYWIYYDDPPRQGGPVNFFATTNYALAAQINDRHAIGTIVTPAHAAGDTVGHATLPPGIPSAGL